VGASEAAIMVNPLFALDYQPRLPQKTGYGIGIIGAGQIVNQAHLPAYRKAGFRVLAITDLNRAAAQETAQHFEIPRVCDSVQELLSAPEIEIVDIATPARENPPLAAKALAAGKHVLVQKPMAETLIEAERMVGAAREANRKLAVNHQMRWSPCVRAASDLLRRHLFGEVVEFRIDVSIRTNWGAWPWLRALPYPELYYHTIHYLDTIRGWFGDPSRIYASLATHPQSGCEGPTRTYAVLEYPDSLRGAVLVNHHTMAPEDDWVARFVIEGTDGRCEGTMGLLLNYPVGRSDLLTFSHRTLFPKGAVRLELEGRWFPDAFIGPMTSLMNAITENTQAETSGEEILGTLRLTEAFRESDRSGQAIKCK
jgi:predicted dehydrogenase